jgi:hypothetical protein
MPDKRSNAGGHVENHFDYRGHFEIQENISLGANVRLFFLSAMEDCP